jgi:hypothetical protein
MTFFYLSRVLCYLKEICYFKSGSGERGRCQWVMAAVARVATVCYLIFKSKMYFLAYRSKQSLLKKV